MGGEVKTVTGDFVQSRHTKSLIRVGSSRVNGILYWFLVLLNRNGRLACSGGVIIVPSVASWNITTGDIVLLLVGVIS